jgi:hypothetical protein
MRLSVLLSGTFYEILQVGEMQMELIELQPKLEQAKIDNTKMMKVNTLHFLANVKGDLDLRSEPSAASSTR